MPLLYMWVFFWPQKQKIGFVQEAIHVQICWHQSSHYSVWQQVSFMEEFQRKTRIHRGGYQPSEMIWDGSRPEVASLKHA